MHQNTVNRSPQVKILKLTFVRIKYNKQLESLVNLLTKSKLQERLRTCKIDFKVIWSKILMDPLPAMEYKLPFAILPFDYREGVKLWNNEDVLIM